MKEQKVIIEEIELAYTDVGTGACYLFIHGLGSFKEVWTPLVTSLAEKRRCICLDLPGHGNSKTIENYSIPVFVQFLEKFISKLKLKEIRLCGHSMGGQICMALALRCKPVICKLILVSPAGLEQFTRYETQILKTTFHLVSSTGPVEKLVSQFNSATIQKMNEKIVAYQDKLHNWAGGHDLNAVRKALVESAIGMMDHPTWNYIPEIDQSSLIIFGDADPLIPNKLFHPFESTRSIAERGCENFPNGRLICIEGVGHFPQLEARDEVLQAIEAF